MIFVINLPVTLNLFEVFHSSEIEYGTLKSPETRNTPKWHNMAGGNEDETPDGAVAADIPDISDCEIIFDSHKSSWLEIKDNVRSLRQKLWAIMGQRVPTSFIFNRTVTDGVPATKIYFMSTPSD